MKWTAAFLFLTFAATVFAAPGYRVSGEHAVWGAYEGVVSGDPLVPGVVWREVNYPTATARGYAVREVWRGQLVQKTVLFQLQSFSFVTRVGPWRLADSSPRAIEWRASLADLERGVTWGARRESWRAADVSPVVPAHLARETRVANSAMGVIARSLVDALGFRFLKDPEVARFKSDSRFQEGVHRVVEDRTNQEFLRENPRTLRLVQKELTPGTLFEEEMRARAYGISLREKARIFEEQIPALFLDASGLIVAERRADGRLIPDISTALWSGIYVASESWRWRVTKDPRAYANLTRALDGLLTLVEIPEDPAEFARSLRPHEPRSNDKGWVAGRDTFAHLDWLSNGNNDMLRGIVYGFVHAHAVLPSQDPLRPRLREAMIRLADYSRVGRSSATNEAMVVGAAALIADRPADLQRYRDIVSGVRYRLSFGWTLNEWDGISDWSGNHLAAIRDGLALHLSSRLAAVYDDREWTAQVVRQRFESIRRLKPTLNALVLAREDQLRDESGKSATRSALAALAEYPVRPNDIDVQVDHSKRADFVMSPYPALPWKYWVDGKRPVAEGLQGLDAPPLFEILADNAENWRLSPFRFRAELQAGRELPASDFLHAYWLARLAGVISADD